MVGVVLGGCAKQSAAQAQTNTVSDSLRNQLVPAGLGTLKQDEFTMALRSGALLVKVTPLSERVIRFAAPDTYNRLHALAESRRAEAIDRTDSKEPELFLVSFFSYQPDVTFSPEDVQLEYNGRQLRAGAIFPVSPSWGKQMMGQQETQVAVYVFADPIDFEVPIGLRYGMEETTDWQRVIPKLQEERTKIISRSQKP
jgi:hypothetical protein